MRRWVVALMAAGLTTGCGSTGPGVFPDIFALAEIDGEALPRRAGDRTAPWRHSSQ